MSGRVSWMFRFAIATAIGALVVGCDRPTADPVGAGPAATMAGRPVVFVTLAPQKYFVERIAGDRVDIRVLVSQGSSEHQYDPTPQQMVALAEARAFFRLGVSSEARVVAQLQQVAPSLRVIDTREGIALRSMSADEGHVDDDHVHAGDDHDHDHGPGAKDPHIWLDPLLVKTQAETIVKALKAIDPAGANIYEANLSAFFADLDSVNKKIEAMLAPFRGREILVYHPSYGYFADRYGLKQVAVEVDGKEPTPKALEKLIERAKRSGTRTIFYQPQFAVASAKMLANEIEGKAVALDPLSADYLKNLESMAEAIALAFSDSFAQPHQPRHP